MSNISTLYDALITRLATTFPSHQRIANPYELGTNPDQMLAQGYGLAVGSAENTDRQLGSKFSLRREFRVILSRELLAKPLDTDERGTSEKTLLEDHYLLVKDLETNSTVNETTALTKYEEDGGVEFVGRDEGGGFLYIETVFSVEYFENLT